MKEQLVQLMFGDVLHVMKAFCEEKTLGIDSISDIVGMPRIEDNEKWAVVVSKLQKGKDKWKLVKLKETGMIKF